MVRGLHKMKFWTTLRRVFPKSVFQSHHNTRESLYVLLSELKLRLAHRFGMGARRAEGLGPRSLSLLQMKLTALAGLSGFDEELVPGRVLVCLARVQAGLGSKSHLPMEGC